jgi:serine/threonine protein kinase
MAGALSYLHSKNILHGDLTGNNVLLTVTADDRRGFVAKVGRSNTTIRLSLLALCLTLQGGAAA